MPDAFIDPNPILFTLFIIFGFCFLVQMLFYWAIFFRLSLREKRYEIHDMRYPDPGSRIPDRPPGVSVVICAHNEVHNLQHTLPKILNQDYPNFEVLVVNHASDDDTSSLLTDLADHHPHLKVVDIKRDLNFFTGKKFPLSIGIRSAKHDVILLTDADCKPAGKHWIRQMCDAFTDQKEIILGYGSYEKRSSILNKLIRYDTISIAIQYLSFALAGFPYMGVGRNLAYKKSIFFQERGFIAHYRISSGDDDLFINRVARKRNTGVMLDPGASTISEPKLSARQWIIQKKRHLSTGSHYKIKHKLILGLYTGTQVLFWVMLILLLAWKFAWIFVLSVLLFRVVSQYIVFGRCMHKLHEKDLIPFIPLLEWIMILFNSGVSVSNLIIKSRKWK